MVVFIFLNDGPIYSKTEVEAGDALRRGHLVIDRSSTARLQFLSWIQSRYSHHLVQISPLLAQKKNQDGDNKNAKLIALKLSAVTAPPSTIYLKFFRYNTTIPDSLNSSYMFRIRREMVKGLFLQQFHLFQSSGLKCVNRCADLSFHTRRIRF